MKNLFKHIVSSSWCTLMAATIVINIVLLMMRGIEWTSVFAFIAIICCSMAIGANYVQENQSCGKKS